MNSESSNSLPLVALAHNRSQLLQAIQTVKAQRSLHEFVRQAWASIEGQNPYVPGWHIEEICRHLEAVTSGAICNLIINIPPRHMKSLAVSVFWPVWNWIRDPGSQWLFASYGADLAERDSWKCLALIRSEWFQQRWGDRFHILVGHAAEIRNDKGGIRKALGVGGPCTGAGGDYCVIDDPHKAGAEAESEVQRENVLQWYDHVWSTRVRDPRTTKRVLIMQRLHENDLTGHLLKRGGWEHLCLPAEYEE